MISIINKQLYLPALIVLCLGLSDNLYSQDSRSLGEIASISKNFDRNLMNTDRELAKSKNPIIAYNTAVQQFELGKLLESEYFFNLAIQFDPYFSEAFLFLGRIRIQEKKYEEAVAFGEQAVKYNPELVAAHLDLFLTYSRLKKRPDAHRHLLAAAKLDPESVSRTASRLIIEKDDLYGALFFFEKVHAVAPTNVLNALNYAKALMIAGRDLKAEKVLEIAYQEADFYNEHFQLLYSMYFAKLLQHGKHEFILSLASEKVPSTFHSQYLYKSLSYFKMGDMAEFEKNARLYFEYTDNVAPQSLAAWAESQLMISSINDDEPSKRGNQYRG